MAVNTNPYHNGIKMQVVREVTLLHCGRCEREFLAKLKVGQDNPAYECPKCKTQNKFAITWK